MWYQPSMVVRETTDTGLSDPVILHEHYLLLVSVRQIMRIGKDRDYIQW